MCVGSGPVQHRGALAPTCNDTQFWGTGCWKMEHLGSIAKHLNWGCWDFSPEPRSQGTHSAHHGVCTWCLCSRCCTMCVPAKLQSGDMGLGESYHTICWPLILDPVKFHHGLRVGEVFSPSAVCQWRICWINKAFASSWSTAPFWTNLLTLFLIFLNRKH